MRRRRKATPGAPRPTSQGAATLEQRTARSVPRSESDLDRSLDAERHPTKSDSTSATSHEAIRRRTSQLPRMSKFLYRIDFYASLPVVAVSVVAALVVMVAIGVVLGFPAAWLVTFDVTVSSMTLLMVFTIQHTQGREQAATQRKLDELLLATPGAAGTLMMLEEAPREFMLEVEENQREARADIVDDETASGTPDSENATREPT